MHIYLVSSIAHQETGYEYGLEHGGSRDLLVSFLDSADGKQSEIWPRRKKTKQLINQPTQRRTFHVDQS